MANPRDQTKKGGRGKKTDTTDASTAGTGNGKADAVDQKKRSAAAAKLEKEKTDSKKVKTVDSDDEVSDDDLPQDEEKIVPETPVKGAGNIISASPFSFAGQGLTMDSDSDDSDIDSSDEDKQDKAHIIRVVPDNDHNGGISGFVLYLDGMGNKYLGNLMFMKNPTKKVKKFKAVTGIVSRVVHPLEDGEEQIKNVNGYKYRGVLVLAAPNRGPPTEEECRDWYDNTFLPAFKKVTLGDMKEGSYPALSNDMEVRTHWLSVVIKADMDQIYKHFVYLHEKAKMTAVNFPKFCQRNHGNLYSIYKKGTLTKTIFSSLGLKRNQIAEEDHVEFDKYMAKKEAKKQKKQS